MTNATLTRAKATATRLIKKFGRTMQLVSITNSGSSFNPTQSETLTDIIGVQLNYKSGEIDGDFVQRDDKQVLIDSSVEPKTEHRLKDNGKDYSIVSVSELRPADDKILYKLQVRL